MGMTFQAFRGSSGAQIAFTILLATSIGDRVTQCTAHERGVFQKFPETIFTPKKWFLSKKGPKEGERVARGHFHERVGESPVHWLPPGVGFTQKPFSVSENEPFENFLRSNSIFI